MKKGETRSHVFRFTNSGARELQIHGVTASCGCTALLLSERSIPPGGTGQLQVTFRALSVGEPIEKWVTLRSNDPQEPVAKLKILASVPPKVAVRPEFLRWGRLKAREPIPFKTILLSGEGLEIKRIETSTPALQARLREEYHLLKLPEERDHLYGGCAIGRSLSILADGRVLMCCRLPLEIGMFPGQSFAEVFIESPLLKRRTSPWPSSPP